MSDQVENKNVSRRSSILYKLCRACASYTSKYQDHRTGEKYFKGSYHIWAWRPSWSCDLDHFHKFLSHSPILKCICIALVLNYPLVGKKSNMLATLHMSLAMRKPDFCICENKDADQLRSNCAADQRLCFRYIDTTIHLLSKSEISSL